MHRGGMEAQWPVGPRSRLGSWEVFRGPKLGADQDASP